MARSAARRSTTPAPTARPPKRRWLNASCRVARTSRAPARRSPNPVAEPASPDVLRCVVGEDAAMSPHDDGEIVGRDLLGGPPPTLLPDEPEPRAALERGDDPAEVAARWPTSSAAWAA